MESSTEVFRAQWNNMPTWCRYCHKDGHTKFECAASKARILCYSCHEQGHRSYECPRKNLNTPYKKKDRKSYKNKELNTDDNKSDHQESVNVPTQQTTSQDSDAMSTDDEGALDDDTTQQFVNEKYEYLNDLNEATEEDRNGFIQLVHEANEIHLDFGLDDNDNRSIVGISLIKKTARATALFEWLNQVKFAQLADSPSIVNRRPSQLFHLEHSSSDGANKSSQ